MSAKKKYDGVRPSDAKRARGDRQTSEVSTNLIAWAMKPLWCLEPRVDRLWGGRIYIDLFDNQNNPASVGFAPKSAAPNFLSSETCKMAAVLRRHIVLTKLVRSYRASTAVASKLPKREESSM